MIDLSQTTACLQRQGWRRLLVISGEPAWVEQRVAISIAQLPGDWLWVGGRPQTSRHCPPAGLRNLLGCEYQHAVFDAREGLHTEALAALAGTLQAGSWLLLLLPPWQHWSQQPDADSLRWGETDLPIAAPNFVQHLQALLLADSRVGLWRQGFPDLLPPLPLTPPWQPDNRQQQQFLDALLCSSPGVNVLTAPRGRGKSALAGMLAARWAGRCLVTAPAKVSTAVLAQFAADKFHFVAPDHLLADAEQLTSGVDWLLIDEAAAIPAPLLQRLVALFPRVLLTTTVQGYEGTGRGFLLKFCAELPDCRHYQLNPPLRWADNDPLEQFIARGLLFDDCLPVVALQPVRYQTLAQSDWVQQPARMAAVYQLLTSAHYRTSPLDLRRMMDAPGMHFIAVMQGDTVQGAVWQEDEGGLSAGLASAVWAGTRRPRGNLVAQSLAAHAGFTQAAQLCSRRISRIALAPQLRGRGVGQQLITRCREQSSGLDFLSVSFGFTAPLWQFWQRCGFRLVRIGSQREASSGCYTAMAILPISEAGRALAQQAAARLAREGYWLRQQLDAPDLPLAQEADLTLTPEDWRELAGFAWAHRPFESSLAALGRLVSQPLEGLSCLRAVLLEQRPLPDICQQWRLSGRRALLITWRQEVQQGLVALDAIRAVEWREWVNALQ